MYIDRSPFGPELSVPNNTEYRAQAGELIELPCGIASLSTNAQISWRKDGIKINNIVEKIYNNSLILKISSSSANDSGIYACRIDDESIGQITSVLSLQVNRKLFNYKNEFKNFFSSSSNSMSDEYPTNKYQCRINF